MAAAATAAIRPSQRRHYRCLLCSFRNKSRNYTNSKCLTLEYNEFVSSERRLEFAQNFNKSRRTHICNHGEHVVRFNFQQNGSAFDVFRELYRFLVPRATAIKTNIWHVHIRSIHRCAIYLIFFSFSRIQIDFDSKQKREEKIKKKLNSSFRISQPFSIWFIYRLFCFLLDGSFPAKLREYVVAWIVSQLCGSKFAHTQRHRQEQCIVGSRRNRRAWNLMVESHRFGSFFPNKFLFSLL